MNKVVTFVLGAGCGAITSWLLAKNHYEKIANKELKERLERQSAHNTESSVQEPVADKVETKEEIAKEPSELKDFTGIADYYNYNAAFKPTPNDDEKKTYPYKITVNQYEDEYRYYKETLTYYEGDGILANDADEEMTVVDTIGDPGYLKQFDEEGSLYIRDDRNAIDYEITRVEMSYEDVVGGG